MTRALSPSDLPSLTEAVAQASRALCSGGFARALDRLWPGATLVAMPAEPHAGDARVRLDVAGPHGRLQIELPEALLPFAGRDDALPGLAELLARQRFGDWLRARAATSRQRIWTDDDWHLRQVDWLPCHGPKPDARLPVRLNIPDSPAVDLCISHIDAGWFAPLRELGRSREPVPSSLGRLAARRVLRLWETHLPLRVLRALRRGDGLLMPGTDARSDQWDGCAFLVIAERRLCRFDARLTPGYLTHMSDMKPPAAETQAPPPNETLDLPPLDSLTVPVSVEFDAGEMSLGELGDMRRGYVLELPWTFKDATVRVVVAGQTLATGQLVAVGDRLAVRLDRLNGPPGDDAGDGSDDSDGY